MMTITLTVTGRKGTVLKNYSLSAEGRNLAQLLQTTFAEEKLDNTDPRGIRRTQNGRDQEIIRTVVKALGGQE